jgi:4-amino-4-deoxy-L-arabinose transferase-like glycosyltransferase
MPCGTTPHGHRKDVCRNDQATDLTRHLVALWLISVVALLMRLPFFFPAVITWDESTFILMGQSILDGHLPYLKLWDLKPPLAFFSFALFILVLGKSIVAIRLAGTVCAVIVAYICYQLGETIWPQRNAGLVAGLLAVSVIGVVPAAQATMTETVALVPLMCGLLVLATRRLNLWNLAGAGALLGVAALIRLNLLYVSLAVAIVIVAVDLYRKESWSLTVKRQLAFILGHSAIGVAVLLPYLWIGEADLLWRSTLLAPLAYSGSRSSLGEASAKQLHNIAHLFTGKQGLLSSLSWGVALLGVVVIALCWQQWSSRQRQAAGMTAVFTGAVALSIVKSGAAHSHYLIQLVPFVSLLATVFFGAFMRSRLRQVALIGVLTVAIITTAQPLTKRYKGLIAHIKAHQSMTAEQGVYEVAAYLNRHRSADQPVYLMTNHIIYWFINAEPLTKCTTHPSTIGKTYLLPYCAEKPDADANSEMLRVLAKNPEFIVKLRGKPRYLNHQDDAWHTLSQALERNYQLVDVISAHEIYKRLDLSGGR